MSNLLDTPLNQLDRWRVGEPLDHRKLNQTIEAVNRLVAGVRPPRQITYIAGPSATAGTVGLRRLKLTAAKAADTLTADVWDGVTAGESTTLACPWELRRTPFDGQTWHGITFNYQTDERRLADNGTTTEYQVIVPQYAVDDDVWAIQITAGNGGTGLTGVEWQEVFSSRMWVRDNDQNA